MSVKLGDIIQHVHVGQTESKRMTSL